MEKLTFEEVEFKTKGFNIRAMIGHGEDKVTVAEIKLTTDLSNPHLRNRLKSSFFAELDDKIKENEETGKEVKGEVKPFDKDHIFTIESDQEIDGFQAVTATVEKVSYKLTAKKEHSCEVWLGIQFYGSLDQISALYYPYTASLDYSQPDPDAQTAFSFGTVRA